MLRCFNIIIHRKDGAEGTFTREEGIEVTTMTLRLPSDFEQILLTQAAEDGVPVSTVAFGEVSKLMAIRMIMPLRLPYDFGQVLLIQEAEKIGRTMPPWFPYDFGQILLTQAAEDGVPVSTVAFGEVSKLMAIRMIMPLRLPYDFGQVLLIQEAEKIGRTMPPWFPYDFGQILPTQAAENGVPVSTVAVEEASKVMIISKTAREVQKLTQSVGKGLTDIIAKASSKLKLNTKNICIAVAAGAVIIVGGVIIWKFLNRHQHQSKGEDGGVRG